MRVTGPLSYKPVSRTLGQCRSRFPTPVPPTLRHCSSGFFFNARNQPYGSDTGAPAPALYALQWRPYWDTPAPRPSPSWSTDARHLKRRGSPPGVDTVHLLEQVVDTCDIPGPCRVVVVDVGRPVRQRLWMPREVPARRSMTRDVLHRGVQDPDPRSTHSSTRHRESGTGRYRRLIVSARDYRIGPDRPHWKQ